MGEAGKKKGTRVIPLSPDQDIARSHLLGSGFVEQKPEVIDAKDAHVMKLEDVIYYAYAIDRVADYWRKNSPDSIISPLRGSYPPTRILVRVLDGFNGPIKYVPTSNFVEDREQLIYDSIDGCVDLARERGMKKLHIFTVDLALSGTSTKRYLQFLKEFVPKILSSKTMPDGFKLDYSLIKLWQKPEQVINNPKRINTSNSVSGRQGNSDYGLHQGVFFIPHWLCEDKPELLGIDYAFGIPEREGVKLAFAKLVTSAKPIVLMSQGAAPQVYSPVGSQSTADVFVDIVSALALDISSGAIPIPPPYQQPLNNTST